MPGSGRPLPILEGAGGEFPSRLMTPLQAELLEAGTLPEPDALGEILSRPDVAPDAGYGDDGPEPLPGPRDELRETRWTGAPPVYQWEVDPSDPLLESGETSATHAGWDFNIWWQRHPAALWYVAMQAMGADEADGPERPHAIGRSVVVNLVYDERRRGVVAIYGTAIDFRPFVDAFRMAVLESRLCEESD